MTNSSLRVLRPRDRKKPSLAREHLIEATERLLLRFHPSEITTSMVLKEANVARGTLYLHFDDFSSLMEMVLLSAFSNSVEQNINALRVIIHDAQTKEALITALETLTENSQGPGRKEFRFARLRLIAYTERNPRFAAALAEEQRRLNAKFEELFELIKRKGWLNTSLDIHSVTVFVQAYTLGKVIDDVAQDGMSPDAWNTLIGQVISRVILHN